MDKINQTLLFIQKEVDDVVNNHFISTEKKELNQLLKKLNTSIPELLLIFLENQEQLTKIYNNLDLSRPDELVDFLNPYASKLKLDDLSSILLTSYFRRITSVIFSKYKSEQIEITKPISDLYRENTFFIDERFKGIDISIKINAPVINSFKFEKQYKSKCTNFFIALKKIRKIDADTTIENFEVIFSLKKTNKNFKKVNWVDSVFQLKKLIILMMENKILDNDINYLSTIENCFQLKGKDLSRKKLDARGKPHTISYQQELIEKIFKEKK